MTRWPGTPRPGEYVTLPLPLPPLLLNALGYRGDGRLVAVHWNADRDEMLLSDGARSWPADPRGWHEFARHPLVRATLAPYRIQTSEPEPTYALVADLWQGTLSVGLPADVTELVNSQPDLLAAADQILRSDETNWAVECAVLDLFAAAPTARPPSRQADIDIARAARHALRLWLDERLALIQAIPPAASDVPPPGADGLDLGSP
jgi:hypothetical protein